MSAETDRTEDELEVVEAKRQAHIADHASAGPVVGSEFASPVERLASNIGNRHFNTVVARMGAGEGILTGGRVHPDVEAAIASTQGRGQSLQHDLKATLSHSYGAPLDNVSVHTGDYADELARSVDARAFTVGNDIYFAKGEYNPSSPSGRELLAHETAHVVQNQGAPSSGPLTVTTPGDHIEREAESAARDAFA
jgi:hypothetical protein